jgi:hypothetical protein
MMVAEIAAQLAQLEIIALRSIVPRHAVLTMAIWQSG